jgi:hypothetical protein
LNSGLRHVPLAAFRKFYTSLSCIRKGAHAEHAASGGKEYIEKEHPNMRAMARSAAELCEGQEATVLQLPAQPKTDAEAEVQKRVAYTG